MTPETPVLNPMRRVASLDILRGLVIIIMGLDHTRDIWSATTFQPEDLDHTTPILFFTRWITHFCAPIFVFLAGTGAYLYGKKVNDPAKLSRFLWTRGVWLIFLELVWVNFSWSLHLPTQTGFVFVQVIWVIGWSMILLAVLSRLPLSLIGAFGIVLIVLHNALDHVSPESWGALSWLWKLLHIGKSWIPFNANQTFGLFVVYPLIPWVGVMAVGYAFGQVMLWSSEKRSKWLWQWGLGLIALFVILRTFNVYGDPSVWGPQARGAAYSVISFLNVTKYPPSLLFLCMTLGPALLLLIVFEKAGGPALEFFKVFGKVPFFYYFIHVFALSILAVGVHQVLYGQSLNFFMTPVDQYPPAYHPSLLLCYSVWIGFTGLMYFACRWYGKYKFSHDYWWLKYL